MDEQMMDVWRRQLLGYLVLKWNVERELKACVCEKCYESALTRVSSSLNGKCLVLPGADEVVRHDAVSVEVGA